MLPLVLVAAPPVGDVPYVNARFGFSVDRPAFLAPQRPPDNGDGREFRQGRIVMRVFARWNVDGTTASRALQEARKELDGAKPLLALAKPGWYALSWSRGGLVRYEKSFVSRTKVTTLEFEYPASEGTRMAPIVTRVVRSFRP